MFYGLRGRCHGKAGKKVTSPIVWSQRQTAMRGPLLGRGGVMNHCLADSEVSLSVTA